MTISLHPLRATALIRDSYLRYLKTSYPLQDCSLRNQFFGALEEQNRLVKGPMLEGSPPFETGRSIDQLIMDGVLHPGFRAICSPALPLVRPLYFHQDLAIEKVSLLRRNIVIATGTGSGKTEAFLIPIINHLLNEHAAGTLDSPGVRALLLYPMNALANDQLKRLRRTLQAFPSITFGRYTGDTDDSDSRAEARYCEEFPDEPRLSNELISREMMRKRPPHILLTNYAMLEYLLLRPHDCEFFDGATGQFWRFIVVDEAHVYDGATGIEIAMLIRRLKDRVVGSRKGRLQCLATSATLGRGKQDFSSVARFATELFGESLEWDENDHDRQDIVEAKRVPIANLGPIWGNGNAGLYKELREIKANVPEEHGTAADLVAQLGQVAAFNSVPARVVEECASRALGTAAGNRGNAFLYFLLRGDGYLHRLLDALAEDPRLLADLSNELFPGRSDADEVLVNLVDLVASARPDPESLSLLPARYHVFARSLEGAFVCLNSAGHGVLDEPGPNLFLTRHEKCPECGSRVFELATCQRCGTAYIVGKLEEESGADSARTDADERRVYLRMAGNDVGKCVYFAMKNPTNVTDEDEVVASGGEIEATEGQSSEEYCLCLNCGAITCSDDDKLSCDCDTSVPRILVQKVESKPSRGTARCVVCGSRGSNAVSRAITGQDAPVSVLATSLYQVLPPSEDMELQDAPGEGRKLLIFSDSRQDAAFFSPYLERTYENVLRRRLLYRALREDPSGQAGRLRLRDMVGRFLAQAERAGLFTQRQSFDERSRIVSTWLTQEFIAIDHRMSLEGLGMLEFRLVKPHRWVAPQALLNPPWNLTADEAWGLITLLLNTLRQQGAIVFPDNVSPTDEAFSPRNRELFVREQLADAKQGILSWLPTRGTNRRLDLLEKLLAQGTSLPDSDRRNYAREALTGLWRHLTTTAGTPWREHFPAQNLPRQGVLHRLSHEFWELVPDDDTRTIFRCSRCRTISTINVRGICPTFGCDGKLEPLDRDEAEFTDNHYRHLYRNLLPIPLGVEEHTAQLTTSEATSVQDGFVRGELNVLSCSTTFELGVDVGDLQAVLMRNMPPTTANYVQRAGRAGRRTDSAAFALTFAQRRSHDLIHYSDPTRIVAGRIKPPAIHISNEKIVRRHVHSVLMAAFLRWCRDEEQRLFPSIGEFIESSSGLPGGPSLLEAYANSRPLELQRALERIVPHELLAELEIENWGWLRTSQRHGLLDLVEMVNSEVAGDLKLFRDLENGAAAERDYGRSEHFKRVTNTLRSRELLGFLASRNILPKYGFPTDVVELKTGHLHLQEAKKVELQRDLRIALSEYAPGSEVVAAKRVWVSGGLYKMPGRDWPVYYYAVCPHCGRFHSSLSRLDGPCTVCGGSLFDWRHNYGEFIIPEFGFVVEQTTPRRPGEMRPPRAYSSQVFFAEYADPNSTVQSEPVLEPLTALSSAKVRIWQRYSRFGKLAIVNSGGLGRGYRVCHSCGFAEQVPELTNSPGRTQRTQPSHKDPRTGRECRTYLHTNHLGHEFLTDVLELRFEGIRAATADQDLWRSLLYAVLEGSSSSLGIRRDDLDGTLYRYAGGNVPALVLFDDVPGGAGHVRRISTELPSVLQCALERVEKCECGEETSCYECLRNYRNQLFHDKLRRGLVRDFLKALLEAAPPTV